MTQPYSIGITDTQSDDMRLLVEGTGRLGISLTARQLGQFRRYYEELIEWNSRVNLTSITQWAEVQTKHFLDSLSVALAIPQNMLESGSLLDIGSGAGFPGLPLKIAFPGLKVTLLDATAKKTAFMAHVRDALGLDGLDVLTGRAETLAHDARLRETFDVVTARAVASMSVLAELTLTFCRIGGLAIAQKTADIQDELVQGSGAIKAMGGRLKEVKQVAPIPIGAGGRALVVIEKIAPTPATYPRRPGMPQKRPL